MPDEQEPDGEPELPHAPFTPEDSLYAAAVSEYVGLQRQGADPVSVALITAAHLLLLGLANAGQQQEPGDV